MSVKVGILMGSDSDLETMKEAKKTLAELGIESELRVCRRIARPKRRAATRATPRASGIKVLIAGAGLAAHLAGALVAQTTLPVIGVPLSAGTLGGLDSLFSTVQMPPGLPVATVAIGGAAERGAAGGGHPGAVGRDAVAEAQGAAQADARQGAGRRRARARRSSSDGRDRAVPRHPLHQEGGRAREAAGAAVRRHLATRSARSWRRSIRTTACGSSCPRAPATRSTPTRRAICNEWLREGVLARDGEPALYRYHQTFTAEGKTATRRGFICRIRLARFDERVVLPHERTLAGPKADRLKLKRATRAHLSQVFGLYSDPERKSDEPFADRRDDGAGARRAHHRRRRAEAVAADRQGGAGARWCELLANEKIYIADGHHRYETMLALRDELRAESANNPRSSVEYGTIFLANMDDPGLLVFPTHRVVHGLPSFDLRVGARARAAVLRGHADGRGRRAGGARRARRSAARARPTFAIAAGDGQIYYLSLRRDVQPRRRAVAQGPRGAAHARRDAAARARHRGHPRHRSRGAGAADQPALRQGHRRGAGAGARSGGAGGARS